MDAIREMAFDQQAALEALAKGDRLFHDTWAHRQVYARLVMAGLARCYVVMGGEEWVRLATEDERQVSARAGNRAVLI